MRYGCGDVVTVVAPVPRSWDSYIQRLDLYVGKSGVVIDSTHDSGSDKEIFPGGAYAVKFIEPALGDSSTEKDGSVIWWFPELVLEHGFDPSLKATGDLQSLFRGEL